ncbi:mucin-19 isoform X3 [Drosophila serrata]|uniref:mucin-19 isoform X3 n=1 Tax=Drosophila serrata TaxID=7274 RepID=UPI000A1D35D3|nr:mucin-19 isoform X3 [Drosophila serrata]
MLPFRRGAAWQTLFLLCALAYCINEASSEGRVVCYYTNWSVYRPGTAKFNPQNINPYLCTHLVYAFGGFTKDNQMKPFDKYQDIEQGGYAKFTGLKTYNKQLKTMIAIGGWNEASSRFSPLVASGDRRQQFIKNILKFLRQNHFDGIDLDWEYPAHREGGKSRDRDNYAQFVQELRAEFEREAEKTGRTRLLLTMAVPAGIEYIDKGYDVPKLNKYLDWFNVLTYDFHSSHEPSVNHHAPLYSLEEDSEYNYDAELNIDYSIKYYLKAGADRDKLVLGIPTYGRSYTLINEESTELGAPSEGPGEQGDATREKGYLAYYEICQTLKDDPEWTVVQPNANVMGPYAYRRNQWVGYDDEAIVRKKAEYVVAQGLGGIMFWAIDNDDFRGTCNGKPYPLIEAAKEAMVEALGLGINEVAKSSGPQKPSRSRSRDNASTRNRLNGKTEAPANSRRPSAPRRPAISSTTSTQAPPPSTTFKLTEAEGSSLYIGGRGSTTPPPPTTPDPGSDFKCEEEGFFQHPRDCKKYYWCLDSGPSGLGIVAHMFTCPSGLYFNPAADSCDFARNVPCKTKKSTTAAPVTTSTSTTTTARPNRVTAAPTARPVYPRPTTSTSTTTTTTTTTPAAIEEDLEYEEDTDELSPSKSTDAEEDPQVIKELIDLIRKVGGVEQLEKHLLRNKDGSITLKENSASGAATTPSTISKSLYDRVLSRPGTLSSFTRNRFKISEATETSTEASSSSSTSSGTGNNYSKYSSVLRGNSRQGPQNEGIEKLAEFDGFLKERKQYVTINRHRSAGQGEEEETQEQQEEEQQLADVATTTRRPLSSVTPSYTSLRRTRPTTVAPAADHSQEEVEEQTQTPVKSYATLSRTRGRTTAAPSEVTEASPSSTTNRYKYFERTRPTKSATAEDVEDPLEEEEEEYEDEALKEHVTNRYQLSRTRGTTTTTPPPSTSTQSPTAANARRLAFGARQRAQVTKLTLVEEQTAEETEAKAQPHEPVEDDAASVAETESNEDSTETGTTTTTRPTPKRIRVLKFRRPLNSNSNSSTVDSTTNSATDTNPDTQTTATATPPTTTSNTNTTVGTNGKRFRKIVRKLRPVDSSTAASVDNSEETTRKPFVPSHSRFVDQEQNQTDLLSLRQRLKEQQAKGEPQDGVISSRFKASGQKDDQENVSDLQKLRDKVKAEQARGDGDQGVINDRLKKLLAEKSTGTSRQGQDSASPARDDEQSSSVSSPRPFFKRKLVARRPYTPSSASGGSPGTTKAPLAFSTSRPTAKFVRRKNGRFDPFNSSVRNRGEGFVRSDPRGARLPGTDRFKTQGNEDDEEELEAQQEHPLQNQFGTNLRRPFVPKTRPVLDKSKTQQEDGGEDSEEDDEEEDEDSEEEGDEEEDEDEETGEKKTTGGEEKPSEDTNTNKPKFNSPYRPKDNRMPPGSRPNFGTTGSGAPTAPGNVPFNPRNRPPTGPGSSNTNNPPNRFGSTKRPRVVNRPPGVASPNLTLKPVASDYERTTPLTPLKPAPFIPSNTRSYERKYSGPSTEAAETASENSLIEDLNIDALNARNKKIFDKHSKKHTTLKPKVSKVETEAGVGLGAEVETGTEVATEEETTFSADQGYVTTTPSTPAPPPPPSPPSTQLDTATATNTDTPPETETETEPVTDTETATNANEATSSVNSQDQPNHTTQSSTTQAPPPATTLLHVFTLIEGEGEGEDEHTTTRRPAVRLLPTIQTEVVPKHKVVEINRIVEINSKQAKAAQRKSKANQDFGTLRVESLPHVEQLGEISVVKYVHLVDGSDIQINDGHSTVADYTPTEPTTRASGQSNSPPVRNSVPETEGSDRDGKSLLPEVLSGALETSTISLEGLFDSARKGKQLSTNSIFAGGELPTEEEESTTILSSSASATENGESTTLAPTYPRQPSTASVAVSRRPVLSVRRRIINSPASASTEATATTQSIEPATATSKYGRLRSRPSAAAAAAATAATTTGAAGTTTVPAATSAAASGRTNNSYLNKLKAKSSAAAAAGAGAGAASGEAATQTPTTSSSSSSSNDITQKQHKFQPASFALRRQFQTRRLTTFAPATNGDESATEVPRTQNPLFKRRLTLISTTPPSARTTFLPSSSALETTTSLYLSDDDEDQVAKSSIHTSRFNQIPEQVRSREEYELPSPPVGAAAHLLSPANTTHAPQPALPAINQGIRRQLIPRPRRPQSTTAQPASSTASVWSSSSSLPGHSAPPLSRRQQSRRRPHKYIEVYSRPPSKSAVLTATSSSQLLDEGQGQPQVNQVAQRRRSGSIGPAKSDPKVIVHGRGIIECRAQGNFPHPLNCRKFISCARFEETGGIVGWEYTCPKGLTYDGVGGMCTWSPSDQPCRD